MTLSRKTWLAIGLSGALLVGMAAFAADTEDHAAPRAGAEELVGVKPLGGGGDGIPSPMGGGGDGVPSPFGDDNHFGELADGESYILYGTIGLREEETSFGITTRAFLRVDLERHGWLANAKRKLDPTYRLQGAGETWRKYAGKDVRVNVMAHGSIERPGKGLSPEYVLSLEVVKPR